VASMLYLLPAWNSPDIHRRPHLKLLSLVVLRAIRRELYVESYTSRAIRRELYVESYTSRAIRRELYVESYTLRAIRRELYVESYTSRAIRRELYVESYTHSVRKADRPVLPPFGFSPSSWDFASAIQEEKKLVSSRSHGNVLRMQHVQQTRS
jgi:hypothetical protein